MFFNSGIRGARARDGVGSIAGKDQYVQKVEPVPSITSWAIQGSDDRALNPAGGQTVVVTGTGFAAGLTGIVGGTNLASVTVVSPYQATFTSPAAAAGSYTLILSNSSGTAAIYIPGLTYSSVPTYTTAAGSIGTYYETTPVSTQVVATSDSAMTYSLASGALPSGTTLYANGVITGTAPVDSSSTTYSFAITATDVELQDVTRSFTLTINTDVVTWSSPGSGTTYNVVGNTPISNVTLTATSAAGYNVTYTANALPTGLTLNSGVISGTPTVEANTTSLLTATAATTNRSATNTIYWIVTLNDSYFKYNSLLMSSTVVTNTFATDASSNNFDITIVGDTKPSKFDPFEPGYYSIYSPTVNDYYSYSDTSSGNFGTGNFTVEGWFYFTATAHNIIMPSSSTSTWGLLTYGDQLYWQENGGNYGGVGYGTVPKNQWVHLAVSRTGGFLTAYINGTRVLNSANTYNYSGTPTRYIGPATGGTNSPFWLSNIRYIKGTGIYSGTTFTVPTSPLTAVSNTSLLICQSNRMIDNSVNAVTFTQAGSPTINPFQPFTPNSSYATYGSTLFDGTGDYLTVPSNAALTIGTSSATVEFWMYPTAIDGYRRVITSTNGGFSTGTFCLRYNNSSTFALVTSAVTITFSTAPPANTWSHIAWVGVGGTSQTLYLNGVSVGTGGSYNYTEAIQYIGGYYSVGPAEFMVGYMSNARVVKGTAVYTSAFTPPAAPLTAITNTSLLTCQTTVPATTTTMVDESSFNNSITRFGNTNIGTFGPLNGSWSNSFDGTGDYLSIPTNTALDFSTGDFTVEGWVFPNALVGSGWFIVSASGSGGFFFGYSPSDVLGFGWGRAGVAWDYRVAGSATLGVWQHVAVTRSGTSMRLFVNGTQVGTTQTISTAYNLGTTSTTIGSQGANYYLNGYISNLRVVKGTAVYTANFTPSTTPLNSIANTSLLTCNSPSFVDYSPINSVITRNGDTTVNKFSPFPGYITNFASYSGFFDGTGDYLSIANNAAFDFSAGDFTVELWFNFTSIGASAYTFASNYQSSSAGWALQYRGDASNVFRFSNGDTALLNSSTQSLTANTWYHLAASRSGTSLKLFLNGVQIGSTTNSTSITSTAAFWVGGLTNVGQYFIGYISNLRVVKGTAVYTAAFTPPTAPLTAIANTQLLTCQSTTFIDNSTNAFAITVNGNTQPVIQNPFVNTFTSPVAYSPTTVGSSMYFDGTTDYLTAPNSTAFGFSNGDFTIEFWVYPTVNARQDWVDVTDGTNRVLIYYSGSAITFYSVPTNAAAITGPAMVLNAWQHIALSKNSGSSRLYVNGAQVGTTYASNQNYFTTSPVTIGKDSAGSTYATGYMSNVRIVKGTGLYPGPFVPSNSPLPAVQNTTLLLSSTITPSTYDATELSDMETAGTAKLTTSNSPYYSSYSGYFDGTGDNLSVPNTFSLPTATTPFTMEAWVYFTAFTGTAIASTNYAGSGALPFIMGMGAVNGSTTASAVPNFLFYNGTAWTTAVTAGSSLSLNTWYHLAYVYTGSSATIYANGTSIGTASISSWTTASQATFYVGRRWDTTGGTYHTGYISNFRLVIGTAVYTSTFTPPTAPLTAISGTQLLTCQSNRFIDNSTNACTITKVGDTRISTLQPFSGSNATKYSSAYFPTKTDYLGMRPQPGLVTFPSDFTFECWVYPTDTALTSTWGVWDSRQSGGTANAMIFFLTALASPVTGSWRLSYYNGTQYYGTGTVLSNQWTYVAWVRSGTTMTFYVNGVAGGTATISGTQTGTATTNPVYIGSKDSGISGFGIGGYIADLRITNGYARYSTTFTPPTTPLLGF